MNLWRNDLLVWKVGKADKKKRLRLHEPDKNWPDKKGELARQEGKYNWVTENDQCMQEEVTLAEMGSIGLASQGELG